MKVLQRFLLIFLGVTQLFNEVTLQLLKLLNLGFLILKFLLLIFLGFLELPRDFIQHLSTRYTFELKKLTF